MIVYTGVWAAKLFLKKCAERKKFLPPSLPPTLLPSLPSSTFSFISNKIKPEKSTLQKQPHFVHENTLQIKIIKVSLNMTGSKMSVQAAEVDTQ